MNRTSIQDATDLIAENLAKDVVKASDRSRKAIADFLLAAKTEVALGKSSAYKKRCKLVEYCPAASMRI